MPGMGKKKTINNACGDSLLIMPFVLHGKILSIALQPGDWSLWRLLVKAEWVAVPW